MSERVVHILIKGRVQGVGFRAWLQHQGQLRGLAGWVRNRRDGSVEAAIAGAAEAVEAMLAVCRTGPATARVESLDLLPNVDEVPSRGFEVRSTV